MIVLAIYLETNALRKLTDYKYDGTEYTSIFSIFELLSGVKENDFYKRKACIERIEKQKLTIRGPMIDKVYYSFFNSKDYNEYAYKEIKDVYHIFLKSKTFDDFRNVKKLHNNKEFYVLEWLIEWDKNISKITTNIQNILKNYFQDVNKKPFREIYQNYGEQEFLNHIIFTLCNFIRNDNNIKDKYVINHIYETGLIYKYNFRLFTYAQILIFAISFFLHGGTSDKNTAQDLIHLLYLSENDILVSNDRIYKNIANGIHFFKLAELSNEKKLSDLLS